jgi:hypothetical protein
VAEGEQGFEEKEDQIYSQRLAEMVKKHSSEALNREEHMPQERQILNISN